MEKNINTWLNTIDIGNVLNQYHQKYPDFEFIGPVPLDFDKKLTGHCVVDELCKLSMANLYRKNKKKIRNSFNLDPHDKPGSHWVSMLRILTQEEFITLIHMDINQIMKY